MQILSQCPIKFDDTRRSHLNVQSNLMVHADLISMSNQRWWYTQILSQCPIKDDDTCRSYLNVQSNLMIHKCTKWVQ